MNRIRSALAGTFGTLSLFFLFFSVGQSDAGASTAPASHLPVIKTPTTPQSVGSWQHLSSRFGDLSPPGNSTEQVLTLVGDIDRDGVNDFVIGSRRDPGPALVWYRREGSGWSRQLIEPSALRLEAGGAVHDIDGDGDPDIVAGYNNQGNEIWWWENPHPNFQPDTGWTRRAIKNSGANKHHDMMFGNFDDDPGTEFVFWNQGASKLFIVDVPADPTIEPWPNAATVFDAPDSTHEGLAQADIDGDGKADIIGDGYWFKHTGGGNFTPNLIENAAFPRVAAGQLVPGGRPEIVQVPGDSDGIGRWFQWDGASWIGRDLPLGTIRHGHSLDIADVNGDGLLDIFVGEMRFDDGNRAENPDARTAVLLGDGAGNFAVEIVATGFGQHESRVADLDGDGDMDILGKPFTWDTPRVDVWLNGSNEPACDTPLANWSTHVIDAARPYRAVFIDAADLDGDGYQDIITGAWWYRNPGALGGAWQRNEIGAPLNQLAVIADFDGDGDADILGTKWDGANPDQIHKGDELVWAQNDGAGNFVIHENIQPGNGDFLQGAVVNSFTPGTREVILSWHNGAPLQRLTIPADPVGTEWQISTASTHNQGEDLSTGDIDRDGDIDLLLGTVWLENGGGTWSDHVLFATTDKPDRNEAVDMNGDGRLDAMIGYETNNDPGKLAWYESPADPDQPWTEQLIDTIIAPMSLDVGDLDGDGDPDVVAGEHYKANPAAGRVFAYENDGGVFRRHLVALGDEHHDGTQLVDIDNDGDLDIISIGWDHGRVLVYEQTGCTVVADPTSSPTATPVESGTPTATPGGTATPSPTPAATGTSSPAPGGRVYYFSSTSGGRVSGLTFADEDILRYDMTAGQWTLYFDGSAVGLAKNDIDAFHLRPDGSLLLSLSLSQKLSDAGSVDDSDVLRFVPDSPGVLSAGRFELVVDGSDVGLTTSAEDVDEIVELADGRLLISTVGNANVGGLPARDSDLLLFTPSLTGANTAGTWSLHIKGAGIGLKGSDEDVRGAALSADGELFLATQGPFQAGEAGGGPADVFSCRLTGTGEQTACAAPTVVWRGGSYGFGSEAIDALQVSEQ